MTRPATASRALRRGGSARPLVPTPWLTRVRVGSRAAELQDLLPGIINQLGPDNLANLKKLAETYQSGAAKPPTADADDEDVPDLVDNFEEASK